MPAFLGRILNLLQLAFVALWTGVWITVALVAATARRRARPALALAHSVWAPGVLWALRARLRVEHLERLEPRASYYFASNHQSMVDIPALFAALPYPLHFVAKAELVSIPFLGWYMRATGMVLVARGSAVSGRSGTLQAARRLSAGGSILSFPEGTRSPDGQLLSFKKGGFVAALETATPVVPVAVIGASQILPARTLHIRPGLVLVRIGEPIGTEGLEVADRAALAVRVQEAVAELMTSPAETDH